jgi:hypothetical protein
MATFRPLFQPNVGTFFNSRLGPFSPLAILIPGRVNLGYENLLADFDILQYDLELMIDKYF